MSEARRERQFGISWPQPGVVASARMMFTGEDMNEEKSKPTFAGAGVMKESEGVSVTGPGQHIGQSVTHFAQDNHGFIVPAKGTDLDEAERLLNEALKTVAYLKSLAPAA